MSSTTQLDRGALVALAREERPLSEVRDLLVSWIQAGATRDEIRSILDETRRDFHEAGQMDAEDRILDALDLVEDWVSPHMRLTFPTGGSVRHTDQRSDVLVTILVPNSAEFAQISTDLVVPALREAGFDVVAPSMDISRANSILEIVSNVAKSRALVVDATGLEPMLMYALGIGHALNRTVAVLTQDIEELPFDLRAYEVISYSTRLDEIARLKDDLATWAVAVLQGNSKVASPVRDVGTAPPTPDVVPTESPDEEDLPGLYDLLPSSVAAMEAIGASTRRFEELTNALGTAMQSQTAEVEQAKARGGPGAFARTQLALKTVTAHVDEYADRVAEVMPGYKSQWDSFVQDTFEWLMLVDLEDNEDHQAGQEMATQLRNLRQVIDDAADQVAGFRQAVIDLRNRRLSKALSQSLRRVEALLKEWIDQALVGASQLERMRAALAERLDN